ncbi:PilZ domain-containing protein [Myxococcota bacterium]|nr:PilZ domain-containing protein [Myxococcota bacterium]
MNVTAHAESIPPFDPFLQELVGTEIVHDLDGIRRAVASMVGREVMIAADAGELTVARCTGALSFFVDAPAVRFEVGDTVAITDHRGVQFVGFRATVGAVVREGDGVVVKLFVPREAVFYPGRRHVRLDGTLGADVVLEYDDQVTVARGVDVSMGGIGVRTDANDGFVIGQVFTVHLNFGDGTLSLPARVRTAVVLGEDVRLGLEFAARNEELERRIRSALVRAGHAP